MSDKEVVLIQGIWSNGAFDVRMLEPGLDDWGFSVHPFRAPISLLSTTWFQTKKDRAVVDRLVGVGADGDRHLIAHSNGCRLAAKAMAKGARFDRVVFFAPAWSADMAFPEGAFREMLVFHSRLDFTLWVGHFLPKHEFGLMGVHGYQGPEDPRITNLDCYPHIHHGYFFSWNFKLRQLQALSFLEYGAVTLQTAAA